MARLVVLSLAATPALAAFLAPGGVARSGALPREPPRAGRVAMDGEADEGFGLAPGQKFGPTAPAHPSGGPHRLRAFIDAGAFAQLYFFWHLFAPSSHMQHRAHHGNRPLLPLQ